MASSSLIIAPLNISGGDLDFKMTAKENWIRLDASYFGANQITTEMVFDDGITITQQKKSGGDSCRVKITPSSLMVTKNGDLFIIEFDCDAISEGALIQVPAYTRLPGPPSPKIFSLARLGSSFSTVRLTLPQQDFPSHGKADPGFVISQIRYLACNKAGPVSRTEWALFVKEIDASTSRPSSVMHPSTSSARPSEEHEASLRRVSSTSSQERRAVLMHKLEISETKTAYAKESFEKQKRLYEDEVERLEKEQKEIQRQLAKLD